MTWIFGHPMFPNGFQLGERFRDPFIKAGLEVGRANASHFDHDYRMEGGTVSENQARMKIAVQTLQHLLGVKADGVVGPETLTALIKKGYAAQLGLVERRVPQTAHRRMSYGRRLIDVRRTGVEDRRVRPGDIERGRRQR